jgi:hypothetical protein
MAAPDKKSTRNRLVKIDFEVFMLPQYLKINICNELKINILKDFGSPVFLSCLAKYDLQDPPMASGETRDCHVQLIFR